MASNIHGLDFLNTEHKLPADQDGRDNLQHYQPQVPSGPAFDSVDSALAASAHAKPDLEKQFDILEFLQKHRGSGSALAPSLIYRSTGIDLETDAAVAGMLQGNPKVRTEFIPDPEDPSLQVAHYAYQAKYPAVRDRESLLAQVNRMHTGVPVRDLEDSYAGVETDIEGLITAGDAIAVLNTEDKDKILFPRGESFLVELDGLLSVPDPPPSAADAAGPNAQEEQQPVPEGISSSEMDAKKKSPKSEPRNGGDNPAAAAAGDEQDSSSHAIYGVHTDVDPRKQIRRGEAIQVGGQWFRVSSAIKAGVPLKAQPARAQAPLSVVSLTEMPKRNEAEGYIREFAAKHVPLDHALSETAQQNIRAARQAREKLLKLGHGRSVTGQLTGSYAHASNPTTLAASFATAPSLARKHRPTKMAASALAVTSSSQQQPPSSERQLSKAALEKAAADPALAQYSHARRHGCTLDVREMYLATKSAVPESDRDLREALIEHGLLGPSEEMRRPRLAKAGANVDNDGKPKKRRYYERKDQRKTNTHLDGTEIGALLTRAAEKQQEGKSVGDGGM